MYSENEGYLVAVYIRADKVYNHYEVKTEDLLTFLGEVGGLN